MAKPVVWIPRRLSDATIARARRDYEVILTTDDLPATADEIVAMSARVDAVIPCHSERFSADVVARLAPRLKIVANHSVGTDHCDIPALNARGIVVTNTPGVLADATAELAMMLMLAAARHAVSGDRIVRSGAWDSWSPAFLVGKQVSGSGSSGWAAWAGRSHGRRAGSTWRSTTTTGDSSLRRTRREQSSTRRSTASSPSRTSCRSTAPRHPIRSA
jgi:phosphoglycerate dehydrogenase-like enzyme